jgi:hypothetical protein
MVAALLPGLRHLRTPLACGIVWLAVLWLLWFRQLPPPGRATGLLAQLHDLSTQLGPSVVLAILAFIAYMVGDIWSNLQPSLRDLASNVRRKLRIPTLIKNHSPWLFDQFTTNDGVYRELLPNLGVRRPVPDDLTDEVRAGLRHAMFSDLNRAPIRLLGTDPELHAEYDRYWSEYLLREAISFPAVVLILSAGLSASWHWITAIASVIVAAGAWLALRRSAALSNVRAWGTILEAIYLDRVPAPAISDFALKSFGPLEADGEPQSDTASDP